MTVEILDSPTTKYIGVISGKGGTGKTNVAVEMAAELGRLGKKVVVVDGDIYNDSIPIHLGANADNLRSQIGFGDYMKHGASEAAKRPDLRQIIHKSFPKGDKTRIPSDNVHFMYAGDREYSERDNSIHLHDRYKDFVEEVRGLRIHYGADIDAILEAYFEELKAKDTTGNPLLQKLSGIQQNVEADFRKLDNYRKIAEERIAIHYLAAKYDISKSPLENIKSYAKSLGLDDFDEETVLRKIFGKHFDEDYRSNGIENMWKRLVDYRLRAIGKDRNADQLDASLQDVKHKISAHSLLIGKRKEEAKTILAKLIAQEKYDPRKTAVQNISDYVNGKVTADSNREDELKKIFTKNYSAGIPEKGFRLLKKGDVGYDDPGIKGYDFVIIDMAAGLKNFVLDGLGEDCTIVFAAKTEVSSAKPMFYGIDTIRTRAIEYFGKPIGLKKESIEELVAIANRKLHIEPYLDSIRETEHPELSQLSLDDRMKYLLHVNRVDKALRQSPIAEQLRYLEKNGKFDHALLGLILEEQAHYITHRKKMNLFIAKLVQLTKRDGVDFDKKRKEAMKLYSFVDDFGIELVLTQSRRAEAATEFYDKSILERLRMYDVKRSVEQKVDLTGLDADSREAVERLQSLADETGTVPAKKDILGIITHDPRYEASVQEVISAGSERTTAMNVTYNPDYKETIDNGDGTTRPDPVIENPKLMTMSLLDRLRLLRLTA